MEKPIENDTETQNLQQFDISKPNSFVSVIYSKLITIIKQAIKITIELIIKLIKY